MNLPEQWTTGTVSTNGIELQYYRTGSGEPIVIAHGMYDNGRRWVPLGSALADDYEVITYDARGHGRSGAPDTGYDMGSRVADLVGLVDELNLADPVLLGHSMGAATVAWTAANSHRPRGVVLADPARFHESPDISMADAREMTRERLREAKARSIEERIEDYDDAVHGMDHVRRLAAATDECSPHIAKLAQEHTPVKDAFDEITCPTLVLRRDADVADRATDLDAADRLRDGRLVHIPNAGHYVFRDEYDAASAELRVFLQR
ncbi:alpha/beta fold hydrolase [Natronoarchaeum sp. GCM10025321]|uniref:alpha/beta fold hydrolase n=1 Tax=Natronoarchaeum sp. GCM10025321 TaxID=3252684 RepID=UPI00360F093C